jgi:hypothetical protein
MGNMYVHTQPCSSYSYVGIIVGTQLRMVHLKIKSQGNCWNFGELVPNLELTTKNVYLLTDIYISD